MGAKKILFPAIHRPNRSPSQRFRFEQYIISLEEKEYTVTYSYFLSEKDDFYFYQSGYFSQKLRILLKSFFIRLKDFFRAFTHDVIFIQREVHMLGTTLFERLLKLSGKKIIFDFDDAIWLQQPGVKRGVHFLKKPSKTKNIIKLADVVLAGNQFLVDYAKKYNHNVVLIPTVVDTEYYQTNKIENKAVVIGWSGSHTTINHFKYLEGVLVKLKEKYQDKLKIIVFGDENYENTQLKTKGVKWKKSEEIAVLSQFDIGIMPLENNEWEKGKCGMKALLYMSMGVPSVISPVGVNSEIIVDGESGYLANNEAEWFDTLSLLIDNSELRNRVGNAGRKRVEDKYSVKSQKESFLKLFDT